MRATRSPWRLWLAGIRPRTLVAGAAPVLVGAAATLHDPDFRLVPAFLALVGALALQAGANLVNDVADGVAGVDAERVGPQRLVQAGLATPGQVRVAAGVAFGLAALAGVGLVTHGGWPIVAIGLVSLMVAVGYSAGPIPVARQGCGEAAAFLFFGPVAVLGTAGAVTGSWVALPWALSLPTGLWAAALLLANNLRDRESDARAGRRTLAVRMPARRAAWLYQALVAAAWLAPGLAAWVMHRPRAAWAVVVAAGPAWAAIRAVRGHLVGTAVAPALGRIADALTVAAVALCLALGLPG